jgi:peroxiredoxin
MIRNAIVAMILMLLCVPASLSYAGDLTSLKIGDSAPMFTLRNYDQQSIDLASTCGKSSYTVVMFIATECPVSNAYNERMAALPGSYSGKRVAFVAVNSNKAESVKRIADHAKEHGFIFPVVKDSANIIADRYGAQVTPEIFVLDSSGTLRYHGRIDDDRKGTNITSHDLRKALDDLLAGRKVAVAEAKAFGCSIKRIGS